MGPLNDRPSLDESKYVSIAVLGLVVLTLLKGTLFAGIIPIWQIVDEPRYFAEIASFADRGERIDATGHPQLYATIAAVPYKLAGADVAGQVLAIRLMSVIFTAACVFLTYKVAKVVFPGNYFVQIMAPSVSTFIPQFSYIGAAVNSDILVALWFSSIAYLSALIVRDGLDIKKGLAVAAFCVAGALTKQRIFVVYPVVLVVFVYAAWELVKGKRFSFINSRLRTGDLVIAAFVLIGAFFGWRLGIPKLLALQIGGFRLGEVLDLWRILDQPYPLGRVVVFLFKQFWGYFGWLSVPMTGWLYAAYGFLSFGSVLGFGMGIFKVIKRWKANLHGDQEFRTQLVQLSILGLAVLLSVYALLIYNTYLWRSGHSRYLFIAISPIAVLFAAGLHHIVPVKLRRLAVSALLSLLAVLNLGSLLYVVIPTYY